MRNLVLFIAVCLSVSACSSEVAVEVAEEPSIEAISTELSLQNVIAYDGEGYYVQSDEGTKSVLFEQNQRFRRYSNELFIVTTNDPESQYARDNSWSVYDQEGSELCSPGVGLDIIAIKKVEPLALTVEDLNASGETRYYGFDCEKSERLLPEDPNFKQKDFEQTDLEEYELEVASEDVVARTVSGNCVDIGSKQCGVELYDLSDTKVWSQTSFGSRISKILILEDKLLVQVDQERIYHGDGIDPALNREPPERWVTLDKSTGEILAEIKTGKQVLDAN